jgi:hypothetical protein
MIQSSTIRIQLPLALSKKGKESFIEECLALVAQLVEQLTNDPKFNDSNTAAVGTE